ncbi:MAG TPA: NfeD family protein [Verrucomicrobiae bacterium]|jgi:membrane protein implicated in regulation of membrane protease activity
MEQYVYLGCFAVGLLFTVLSFFFGHLGADHAGHDVGTGGHAEAGYEHSGMPGVSAFSPTILCSFVTALGGFGMILSHIGATKSVWISLPLSLVGGLVIAAGVFWIFAALFSHTQSSSESRIGSLVGRTATVITPIPASGVGEIAYVQAGTRYTAPAREQGGAAVGNGQTVKITRIADSQFFVSPI